MSSGTSRTGVCGRCGREGRLGKLACAEHPDLCKSCYKAHQPRRPCGICGRVRVVHIRGRDGAPDICQNCCARTPPRACERCGRVGPIQRAATADEPALGPCCYRPPAATCSACGRERPCVGAKGPQPLCGRCSKLRRAKRCIDCGEQRPVARRVAEGVLCDSCSRRRGLTTGTCRDCGVVEPLVGGCCAACRLRQRVHGLRERADPAAAATLASYLDGLADAANPSSVLRWLQSPAFALLGRLLAGELEISHAALDEAQGDASQSRAVAFMRAALMHRGALPERDEHAAAFARWQRRTLEQIPAGRDRAHLRAYATWHVAHQLARATQRDRGGAAAQKHARALLSEAVKLAQWLHAQGLELGDLRQDHVDEWVAAGRTTRRQVRLFLAWLGRAEVTGALRVAWSTAGAGDTPLSDDERFEHLRRLLHHDRADPRDRLAGCLLLLYAQPLTRTACLRTTDVAATDAGGVTVRLGRGAVALPPPLGELALALRDQRNAAAGGETWLFAGRKAGAHITADRLSQRLNALGIANLSSRHGALLALAARLPAPILAERLGIHQHRAAQWVRAAGTSYTDYVHLRTAPQWASAR